MLPSPTCPKHAHPQAGRLAERRDGAEQLRHPRPRHHHVVIDLERRQPAQRRRQVAAHAPERFALLTVAAVRRSLAPADRQAASTRGRSASTAAGEPSTSISRSTAAPAGRGLGTGSGDRREAFAVDDFDRRRHDAAGTIPSTAFTAVSTSGNTARRVRRGRPRHETQRHLGHDGQRALGSDQQLSQVVADDVLDGLAAGADDLSGRQHRLETQHVVPRRAVLEARGPPAHSATLPPMADRWRLAGSGG